MLCGVGRFLAVGVVCLGFAVGAEAQAQTTTTYQVFGEGGGTTVTVEDGVLRYESSVTGTITVTVLVTEGEQGSLVPASFSSTVITIITPDHCALVGENCPVLGFTGWGALENLSGLTLVTVIGKILAAGATISATVDGGFQAIHYAASVNSTIALSALITMGASVDARADGGYTPMHVAASADATDALSELISKGASVDARADGDYTPLHIAASVDATAALAELISMGADVNARADDGYTPLHIAAQSGAGAALSLLLTNDAALTAEAADGSTPADIAKDDDTRAALTAVAGAVLFCTHNCAAGMSPYQVGVSLSVVLQNRIARGESRHAAFVFAEGGFMPRGSAYIYNAATDANASVWVTPGPSIVINAGVTMPGTASVFVSLKVPAVVTATIIADDLPDDNAAWQGVSRTRAATAFFTVSSQIANANYAASGNNASRLVTAGVLAVIGTITGATKPSVASSDDTRNFRVTVEGGAGGGTVFVAAAGVDRGLRTLTLRVSPQSPAFGGATITAKWTVDIAHLEDEVLLVGGALNYTSDAAAQANSIIWAAPATNVASAMWSARATLPETRLVGHKAVNFGGTIVVAGGRVVGEGSGGANVDGSNRVLWSADRGRTWNQYNAPWPKRREFGMVVHGSSLYVVAGYSPTPSNKSLNDTWRTGDISNASGWTKVSPVSPHTTEYQGALGLIRAPNVVSYRGLLLVLGGNEFLNGENNNLVQRVVNGRIIYSFSPSTNRWGVIAFDNRSGININAGHLPQESGGEAIVVNNNTVFIMGLYDLEKELFPAQGGARENNTVYFYDAFNNGVQNQARVTVMDKCSGNTTISEYYPSALHFRSSVFVFGGHTRQIRRFSENACAPPSRAINVVSDSSETTPANTQNTRAVFVARGNEFFQRVNENLARPFYPPRFHLQTVFAAPSAITVPAGLQVSIHLMSFVPQGTPPFTILTPNNFPELVLGLREMSVYHLSYQGAWPSESQSFNVLVDAVQFRDGEENMITLSFTLYAGTPSPIRYEFPNNARIVRGEGATVTASSIGGGVIGAYAFSYGGRNLTAYSAASVLLNGNISMSIAANTPANFGLFRVIAVAIDRRTSQSNPNAPRGIVTVDIPIIDERLSVGVLPDEVVTIAAHYAHAGYHLASITARGGVGAYSYSLANATAEYGVSETGAVSLKLRAGGYRGLTTLTIRVSDGTPPVSRDARLTVQSETYRPLSAQTTPPGKITINSTSAAIAGTIQASGGIPPHTHTASPSATITITETGEYRLQPGEEGYTITTTLTTKDSALGILRANINITLTITAVTVTE